jgi:ketosteroid isomerase-like protein
VAVLSPGVVEEPVTAVLIAALAADSRHEAADSLWDPDATVVANGQMRYGPPRFAGVGAGGQIAISSSRLEVRQSLVWVFLEYRWLSLPDGPAREAKATVLLTPRQDRGGWKIVHAHSSTGTRD